MTDRERSCSAHRTRFGPKHYGGVRREASYTCVVITIDEICARSTISLPTRFAHSALNGGPNLDYRRLHIVIQAPN